MSQMTSRLSLYFGVWMSRKSAHHLRAAGAEAHRARRLALRDAPDLRVVERAVLDRVDDVRPAPARCRSRSAACRADSAATARVVSSGCRWSPSKPGPALQRVVVPGAARHVLVAVKVAVREQVEPGALLVADDDGHRVLELLAKADVEHAGVERLAPHADVEPAGPGP